jgi:hypothetical protein
MHYLLKSVVQVLWQPQLQQANAPLACRVQQIVRLLLVQGGGDSLPRMVLNSQLWQVAQVASLAPMEHQVVPLARPAALWECPLLWLAQRGDLWECPLVPLAPRATR